MARSRRRPSRVALAVLLVLSSWGGGSARADCSAGAPASQYQSAREAFQEHRYDESIALLRSAYECDRNPVYLGNVARAYEEANRPEEALAAWRAYVEVVKTDAERVQAQGRISTLSKLIEDLERLRREKAAAEEARRRAELEASAARTPPPARAESPPSSRRVPLAAWGVMVAGGLGLATGAVLGVEAQSRHTAAVGEPDVVRAESLQQSARSLATAANWAFALGGGVAAIGLAWVCVDLLAPSTPSSPRAGVVVTGPGVLVVGAF